MSLITSATLALSLGGCGDTGEVPPASEVEPAEDDNPRTQMPATAPGARQQPKRPGKIVTDMSTLDLPQTDERFEPGQALWAFYSIGDPPAWTFGKVRYEEPRGRSRVAVAAGGTHELPSAFVQAASPAENLSPGLPVTVDADGVARFGRVRSISGDAIRVAYALGHDEVKEAVVSPADVRPFQRRALEPGAPVLFSSGNRSYIGLLALATGERAYVICGDLLELNRTEVTPLDTSKLLKPGDHVVAIPGDAAGCEAVDGEVIEMKDTGVRYEVELARGDKIHVPFGLVAPHPSLPRPKAP